MRGFVTIYDIVFALLSYIIAIYIMFSVFNYGTSTTFLLSEYYTIISAKEHIYTFYVSPVPSAAKLEFDCTNKKTYYVNFSKNKMLMPSLIYYYCNPNIELAIPGSVSTSCYLNTESIGKIIQNQIYRIFRNFKYYNITIVCKNSNKKLITTAGSSEKYITIKQDYKYYTIYISVWK